MFNSSSGQGVIMDIRNELWYIGDIAFLILIGVWALGYLATIVRDLAIKIKISYQQYKDTNYEVEYEDEDNDNGSNSENDKREEHTDSIS